MKGGGVVVVKVSLLDGVGVGVMGQGACLGVVPIVHNLLGLTPNSTRPPNKALGR